MKSICAVLSILSVFAIFGCRGGQSTSATSARSLAPSSTQQPTPSPIESPRSLPATSLARLVEVGEFHGDQVPAENGENWIGLYLTETGSSLISSTLIVTQGEDPVIDEEPGQKTGKQVDVSQAVKPLFLVEGAAGLQPGAVTTVYRGPDNEEPQLKLGAAFSLKLGNQGYLLKVTSLRGRPKDCPDCLPSDAKLILESGQSQQVLHEMEQSLKAKGLESNVEGEVGEAADTQGWEVLWVGDLDHDGKLDLYLNLSYHYNLSDRILFLSSRAGAGQLVKKVARFKTSGC